MGTVIEMVSAARTPMRRLVGVYVTGRRARREITKRTFDNHLSILRSFAASYGDRDPRKIAQADIDRWLASNPSLAAGSQRNRIVALHGFTRWLLVERHITRDPMLRTTAPKMPRRVPRALRPDDVEALEAALPDLRAHAITALMLYMGLRRCEVVSVEIGDWDRGHGLLFVRGKARHERLIPVPQRAAESLDAYFGELRVTAGPMIRRQDGTGPLSNHRLGELMRQWMTEAGIKHRPYDGKACHALRHTLASNVADVEPDLRVLQEILGHSHLTSTQIYLRPAAAAKMRAAMEASA